MSDKVSFNIRSRFGYLPLLIKCRILSSLINIQTLRTNFHEKKTNELWWDEVFNEWSLRLRFKLVFMRRRSMNSFWSDEDASFIKIPNWVHWGNNYRASGRRLLSLPIQCKTKRTQTIRSETPFEIKPTVFSIKSPPLLFWNSVTTSYVRGCSVWGWTTEEHCWSSCQTRRWVGRQKGACDRVSYF